MVGEPFRRPPSLARCLPARGDAYGAGLRARAASQSKGVDADREGLVTGEIGYTRRVRGVDGTVFLTGVEGAESFTRGELCMAAFACAMRRSDIVVDPCVDILRGYYEYRAGQVLFMVTCSSSEL